MAAAIGNQYAARSRRFYDAVNRALTQDDGKRLRAAAEKLLDLAAEGEQWACIALRDTLDGKPAQALIGGDDDDNPIKLVGRIENIIVDANTKDSDR